jgi:poly-gamma-glutamate synthesis protein (capsule biosynthesis protein)
LAPLEMGKSMKAMGITMVNHANNQTFNGGVAGMVSTIDALDRLGIAHAGTGRNLQEARAAQYVATPKGRIGLIGMFSMDDWSNYGPNFAYSAATYRNGNLGGAPGLNPLRLTAYRVVSPAQMQTLKQLGGAVYGEANTPAAAASASTERFRFFNEWYQTGTDSGALHYEMNAGDRKDILDSIRNGKVYADFLIVNIHTHQTSTYKALGWGGIDHEAPDFLVTLAHESIDNGADMFIAHGVHALRGVEIYKGKPIFYGLSSFVFQFGLLMGASSEVLTNVKGMSQLENPAIHESVLATTRFENGQLMEVRLYPADLGGSRRPISQTGLPVTPSAEEAQRILKELQEFSRPFATTIAIEDNVGVIRVGTMTQSAVTKK